MIVLGQLTMTTQYGNFPPLVRFRPKKHQFIRKSTVLRGILDPIKYAFFKHYTFEDATYGVEHDRETKVDRRSLARNKYAGMAKGKKVDQQLSRAFVTMSKLRLSIAQFVNLKNLPLDAKCSAQVRAAIGQSKALISNTRALLVKWAKRGLTIVATQLPVGIVSKRLGTAIDVVLMDAKGNFYIINVKVDSWKNYDKKTKKNMEPPFQNVPNSKRNHNQLQLLAEKILWQGTYPGLGSGEPKEVKDAKGKVRKLENKLFPEINTVDAEHMVREFRLEAWALVKQNEFWAKL